MQEKTILAQLFPRPTGNNGYEELVRASELLKLSALWAEAQQKSTLSSRRQALSDPPVRQARALIQNAALKPLNSPTRALTAATTFPEFAGFRDCARLLSAEIHVLFSEGRSAAALVSFAQGLYLGRAPKAEVLIGGLVGIAIDAILLNRVKIHLEQLTPRDCDRVQATLREHIEQDRGNAEKALAAEMRFVDSLLPTLADAPLDTFQEIFDDDDVALSQLQRQFSAMQSDPVEKQRFLTAFKQGAQTHQARAQAYLANPHVRLVEQKSAGGTLEGALLNALTPTYTLAVQKFVQDRIQCQLLYCHAAIRRYKWEWEKLPDSLEALRLGDVCLDPYTRQPLRYEKEHGSYELFSVGPADENNQRTPVDLPWRAR